MQHMRIALLVAMVWATAFVARADGLWATAWAGVKRARQRFAKVRQRATEIPDVIATVVKDGVAHYLYADGTALPMMAGGDVIDRTDAGALIPEEVAAGIIKEVAQESSIMRLARKLPNMSRRQQRLPVLAGLVSAGFVNGEPTNSLNDSGQKPTSRAQWANKVIEAEEIAVIVPIPEAVLDDADFAIWDEVRPQIVEAFGAVFDAAVLYGTNAPSSWPDDILTGATAAGQIVVEGTGADLYTDLFEQGGVLALVEEDGYNVTGHLAALSLRAKLRALRDTQDRPMFIQNMQQAGQFVLDGVDMIFPKNGAIDADQSLDIAGDWSKLVFSLRQDITYKILTEAVIQDTDGSILYNLAQQDMVALRAVMRLGWQLPNPVNRVNTNSATRFPFAVLAPAGS